METITITITDTTSVTLQQVAAEHDDFAQRDAIRAVMATIRDAVERELVQQGFAVRGRHTVAGNLWVVKVKNGVATALCETGVVQGDYTTVVARVVIDAPAAIRAAMAWVV